MSPEVVSHSPVLGIHIEEEGSAFDVGPTGDLHFSPTSRLTIIRTWRYTFSTILCVLGWVALMALVYSGTREGTSTEHALSVGLTLVIGGYIPLAMLVNRTVFVIDDGLLTVRHSPLPWTPTVSNFDLRHVAFVRLHISKVSTYNKRTRALALIADVILGTASSDGGTVRRHSVAAVLYSGHPVPIFKYNDFLVPMKHTLAICEAINHFLAH